MRGSSHYCSRCEVCWLASSPDAQERSLLHAVDWATYYDADGPRAWSSLGTATGCILKFESSCSTLNVEEGVRAHALGHLRRSCINVQRSNLVLHLLVRIHHARGTKSIISFLQEWAMPNAVGPEAGPSQLPQGQKGVNLPPLAPHHVTSNQLA